MKELRRRVATAMAIDVDVWRRVAKALAVGVVATTAGAVLGGPLAAVSFVACSVVAVVVFFLGVSSWAIGRIGSAGVGAGLLGCIACIGSGIEVPRWWRLAHAPQRELSTLQQAPVDDHAAVLHVPGIELDDALTAWATWTSRSGKSTTTQSEVATPLVEGAEQLVVGFACRSGSEPASRPGTWLVPLALWTGNDNARCERAIAQAGEKLAEKQRRVDAHAPQRVFHTFASPDAVRAAAGPSVLARLLVGLVGLYTLVVVLFRRRVLEAD
jgi:hypothetical protein